MKAALSKTIGAYRSSTARDCAVTPEQFREVDGMRLLPEQVGADTARRLASVRADHLRPAHARVPLRLRRRAGTRQHLAIPVERPREERRHDPTRRNAPRATSTSPDAPCRTSCWSPGRSPAAASVPEPCRRVRNCERTMRRSSSRQRGSVLPDRSMAPPESTRSAAQSAAAARSVASTSGVSAARMAARRVRTAACTRACRCDR